MGRKKINEAFYAGYIELDRDCCEKFGVSSGGVTEYINRLNNARFAPGRDDVLPRLVRYRNLSPGTLPCLPPARSLEMAVLPQSFSFLGKDVFGASASTLSVV